MVMQVHVAKLKGGTIRSSQLRGKLSAVLLNAQKRALKRLEQYVATWEHKPFFETKGGTKYAGGNIEVNIITDDQVFWWLEDGTSVRYAVMSEDFQAKTAPGQINSKEGQGGYAYLDMRHPRRGIEARNVLQSITALEQFQFVNDVMSVTANVDFLDFGAEENILG